jgi:hypothetical protein
MDIELPDEEETKQMMYALIAWFKSQDIHPSTASIVMANMIALDLVHTANSREDLEEGFDLFGAMVAERINANWKRFHKMKRQSKKS